MMLAVAFALAVQTAPPVASVVVSDAWVRLPPPAAANGAAYFVLRNSSAADRRLIAVEDAIAARLAARKSRNFKEADQLRDDLAAAGIILEDKPDGTTIWRRR